jgi:hypothetical protein
MKPPEEAGIGAAPRRWAHAASERSRPGWSPAAISRIAAVSGPILSKPSRPGVGPLPGDDQLVQELELTVQVLGAVAEFA